MKIDEIYKYVESRLKGEGTGHDYFHALRVENVATMIANNEGGNIEIIKVSALLHDVIDRKVCDDIEVETKNIEKLLLDCKFTKEEIILIFDIINNISYSKGNVPNSLEGKIVQDADRLDALGMIGIARTFAYGGKKNRPLYDENNNANSLYHFDEKLFKLINLMNTETGRKYAKNRNEKLKYFYDEFMKEWNSIDLL